MSYPHHSRYGSHLAFLARLVGVVCCLALVIAPLRVQAEHERGLKLTYDSANRLVRSDDGETTIAYQYDGMGHLVRACILFSAGPSDCSELMLDEDAEHPRIVGEIRTNADGTRQILYAYGPGGLAAVSDGGALRYPLKDHLGSIRGLVDGTGAVVGRVAYDAYGKVRTRVGEQVRLGYTGEWTSEHDLVHLRARHYAPRIGRFLQRDGHLGTPANPDSLNRYTYAHNNPLANTDPSGHAVISGTLLWIIGVTIAGLGIFAAADSWEWAERPVVALTELISNVVNAAAWMVSFTFLPYLWQRGTASIAAVLDFIVHGNSGTGMAILAYADAPRTFRNREVATAQLYLSKKQTWNALRNSLIRYAAQPSQTNGPVSFSTRAFNPTFGNFGVKISGHCKNGTCQGWVSIHDDFDFDVVHHDPKTGHGELHKSDMPLVVRAARNLGTLGAQVVIGLGKKSAVDVQSQQVPFAWTTSRGIDEQLIEAARNNGTPSAVVWTYSAIKGLFVR